MGGCAGRRRALFLLAEPKPLSVPDQPRVTQDLLGRWNAAGGGRLRMLRAPAKSASPQVIKAEENELSSMLGSAQRAAARRSPVLAGASRAPRQASCSRAQRPGARAEVAGESGTSAGRVGGDVQQDRRTDGRMAGAAAARPPGLDGPSVVVDQHRLDIHILDQLT